MRVLIMIVFALGAVSAAPRNGILASLSPLEHTEHTIPEEYIVVFKKEANEVHIEDHMASLSDMLSSQKHGNYTVKYKYHIGNFRGYSVHMDDQTLNHVRNMWEVDYIERNQKVHTSKCIKQKIDKGVTWGLSRISHEENRISKNQWSYEYSDKKEGKDVVVYIIDTGININASEFEGRAKWEDTSDLVQPDRNEPDYQTDSDGHGTAVAGIVMSRTYGVAKMATAIAVRVLGSEDGEADKLIAGFQWVQNHHKEKKNKAIANVSVGTDKMNTVNDAADELVYEGVLVVVSAGNDKQNACNESPGSAFRVVTVAASDSADEFARFSNFGNCVHIIAPGEHIKSVGMESGEKGTSLAAPFVSGVAARLLSSSKISTVEDLREKLFTKTVKNKIKNVPMPKDTPNCLLNYRC